jgi:hypothetical protein
MHWASIDARSLQRCGGPWGGYHGAYAVAPVFACPSEQTEGIGAGPQLTINLLLSPNYRHSRKRKLHLAL